MSNSKVISLKKLDRFAYIVTAVVVIAVTLLRYIPPYSGDLGFDVHLLPAFHAILNGLTAVCLVIAVYFVKQKNIAMHQRFVYVAMSLSAVFLVSYVAYHFLTDPTHYGGEYVTLYYTLLISHIILAGIILPFILMTFNRGFTNNIEKHRKLAKWTFPLWMYVAVTGPIVYLMLKPYY